jgi:hypothetical protein
MVLSNNPVAQRLVQLEPMSATGCQRKLGTHVNETVTLALEEVLHRHASRPRNHASDVVRSDTVVDSALGRLGPCEVRLEVRDCRVPEPRRALILALALSHLEIMPRPLEPFLQRLDVLQALTL